jgi:hypothetical protein
MYGFSTNCVSCHSDLSTPSNAYTSLKGQGYINGTSSTLVTPSSCLTLFGGTMPLSGTIPSTAKCPLIAWVAAGAQNN